MDNPLGLDKGPKLNLQPKLTLQVKNLVSLMVEGQTLREKQHPLTLLVVGIIPLVSQKYSTTIEACLRQRGFISQIHKLIMNRDVKQSHR